MIDNRIVRGYQSSKQFHKVYTPAERTCEIASVRNQSCEVVKCKKWTTKEDEYDEYLVKDEMDAKQLYKQLASN